MDNIKILDGGAAEELIRLGKTEFLIYKDPLWTAGLLHTDPDAILTLHKSFLRAGAEIILTVSYQASIEGFMKHLNITEEEACGLIKKSVYIARQACKEVAQETGREESKVAGSVGPYGACLHDGSEYTGKYMDSVSTEELQTWHRPRLTALSEAGVDMVAIETIPAQLEAEAVVSLIEKEFPGMKAYVTFSCRNGEETCRGEKFCDAIKSVCSSENVIAVGVNCTGPQYITSLLKSIQGLNIQKPILVKPNSGEMWNSGKGSSLKYVCGYRNIWWGGGGGTSLE
ncbi:uncharacterized protein LOC123554973 isoform X2 [Mercenaria mercenaria]|uniref:uncharacterized protein LOC123554973 isoform X2 n=1 Tax=Mercenaria mercenaria TaxID=6596 RepID=UPI00234EAD0F|nr:uncharacterized protein LOC123554973 isoform X2 [Mercenaria mercenaria]